MKFFLYEFISGGGCWHPSIGEAPSGSLLAEGLAMWQAAYADLVQLDDVQVITTCDARLASFEQRSLAQDIPTQDVVAVHGDDAAQFVKLANQCDAGLVIAPEFDGHLENCVRLLEQNSCQHIGPDTAFIRLTTDKQRTLERLSRANVHVPAGRLLMPGEQLASNTACPLVVKRNDGAGSMGRVHTTVPATRFAQAMRVEELVPGTPCSQSFLCRSSLPVIPCPPMLQNIAHDGSLQYLGGERLLCSEQVARATALAMRAIQALPATQGYVGVDMMLGNASDGTEDYVLEVNPRLTTSYIGLRHTTHDNLMQIMLEIALGRPVSVRFHEQPIRFQADGAIQS